MRVVDCHAHLLSRTYFETHVRRHRPPRADRSEGGYAFHGSGGAPTVIPAAHLDPDRQLEELAEQGVDVTVSSMGGFTVDHLPAGLAKELAMQLNEEHAELERRYPGRVYGLALLPMQDAQAAIETLDHAVRTLGLRGVCVAPGADPQPAAGTDPSPIYRRMEQLGVPVFLHAAGAHSAMDRRCSPLDLTRAGVPADCPTLRVAHLCGAPDARTTPAAWSSRVYADTVSLDPSALDLMVETYGPERLLYASGYPYGRPADELALLRERLDGSTLEAVLWGNAAALLGLSATAG